MAKNRRPARRRLAGAALGLAAAVLFLLWSNCSLQTELFTFSSPRLPEGFDGCRIVVLSDLHGAVFGRENQRLVSAVADLAPDFIAVTGDLVDKDTADPIDYAGQLGRALSGIAPVYYVTGNHEWGAGGVPELKEALSAAGWTVLGNRYVPLERNGGSITLAGIDDPLGYADQKTPEELTRELYAAQEHPFWILLAHRNDRFESQYSLLGADLTLSGHGHGGILRLPFTDGLVGTAHNLFPSYTSGFYEAHGHTVFVSRGLGNVGRTFRIFNRPQVAAITLERSES